MGQELPITSYALLGLLAFGDALTGYELKQRADRTMRFYWTAPAMSQVYSELNRLSALGLIESPPSDGPARHRITDQGATALNGWMRETPAGFPVLKHPVAMRLLMGAAVDRDDTIAMLEEYLSELAVRRRELLGVRQFLVGRDAPGAAFRHPALVAEWGLAYFDSEADIAQRMLSAVREDRLFT